MVEVERLLSEAVQHFWSTRSDQSLRQGSATGIKDAGNRSAVTGGKHADGFVKLVAEIIADAGIDDFNIHTTSKKSRTIPGYYRPAKEWDLVVSFDDTLLAAVEVKSQVGSFGNNFNNRVEEAIGNASDFWAAYTKGIYSPSARPWLGYLFMLEEEPTSIAPTRPLDSRRSRSIKRFRACPTPPSMKRCAGDWSESDSTTRRASSRRIRETARRARIQSPPRKSESRTSLARCGHTLRLFLPSERAASGW